MYFLSLYGSILLQFGSKLEKEYPHHIFLIFGLPARMSSSLAFSAMTRPFSSLKQSCGSARTQLSVGNNPGFTEKTPSWFFGLFGFWGLNFFFRFFGILWDFLSVIFCFLYFINLNSDKKHMIHIS